jgi:ribosomal protein S21
VSRGLVTRASVLSDTSRVTTREPPMAKKKKAAKKAAKKTAKKASKKKSRK